MPTRISSYIHYKVWYEIIYTLPNFHGAAAEAEELVSDFILHFSVINLSW